MSHDWMECSDLREIEKPQSGVSLIVIGLEGCAPCDIARRQAISFVTSHDDVSLKLYKFSSNGLHPEEAQIFGEEIRYYPTVIGLMEGETAFQLKGMIRDAHPEDPTRIEKAFARFAARHGTADVTE